jgi:phosphoglycolate phosphatase
MSRQLVIFDFDGTLADSAGWVLSILNELAEKHHFRKTTPEEVDELRGLGNREVMARLGFKRWRLPWLARDLRRRSLAAADHIALFAGAAELIERLAARGVDMAIVTSNGEATVRRVLGEQLAQRIRYYECGVSMFGKSSKLKRLERRSGIAPRSVLCVGDEPRDIEAAAGAGLPCVAVSWGYSRPAALWALRPTRLLDSFEALEAVILAAQGSPESRTPAR